MPWRQEVEELTPEGLAGAMEDEAHDVLVEFYGAGCVRAGPSRPNHARMTHVHRMFAQLRAMPGV